MAYASPPSSSSSTLPPSSTSATHASTSSTIPPEPYDSPVKSSHPLDDRGYNHDGAASDEEGDLGGGSLNAPRRDKGKGRARDDAQYGRLGGSDSRDDQEEQETELDEDVEAARVAENLARWSRADSKRRADLRRSSTLVYPSLPSPPPVQIPSASGIIRRTSTLIRTASRRRSGAGDFRSLGNEELELGGTGETAGVGARRGRKKLSVVTGAGQESRTLGGTAGAPSLPKLGEDEEEELDPARTPTATSHLQPTQILPASSADVSDPTAALNPPLADPFSPSNASFVSFASSERTARTGSRFVEDLPPLPLSPPAHETPHTHDPFMTPTSPTDGGSLPFSVSSTTSRPRQPRSSQAGDRGPNPFSDVVVISPPYSPPNNPARPPLHPQPSQQSIATFASSSYIAAAPSLAPSMNVSHQRLNSSESLSPAQAALTNLETTFTSGGMRRRPPSVASTSPAGSIDGRDTEGYTRAVTQSEVEDVDGRVGWLDFLLCVCWRIGDGTRDGTVEQQGRTNPME
ncbi:hypothetical protein JCM11641_006803 [Rhodosporidiobolus odoratus]